MKLYKYCNENGIYLLGGGHLRLAPPNTFNDPFEFAMNVDYSGVTKEGLREHLRTDPNMFEGWREVHAAHLNQTKAHNYYQEHLDEIVDDAFKRFPENVIAEQRRSCDRASEYWAVACFSEKPDSILMWSHYSNHHRGMVIEFESEYLPFNDSKSLVKVDYDNEKPVFVYKFGMVGFEDEFDRFAKRKHTDWRYEQEWRMIAPKTNLHDGQYIRLATKAVTGVICGCRCTEPVRATVFSLLRQPILRHIRMFDAKLNQQEYKLDIVESPRNQSVSQNE